MKADHPEGGRSPSATVDPRLPSWIQQSARAIQWPFLTQVPHARTSHKVDPVSFIPLNQQVNSVSASQQLQMANMYASIFSRLGSAGGAGIAGAETDSHPKAGAVYPRSLADSLLPSQMIVPRLLRHLTVQIKDPAEAEEVDENGEDMPFDLSRRHPHMSPAGQFPLNHLEELLKLANFTLDFKCPEQDFHLIIECLRAGIT